jgi:hypothetical protein
MLPSGGNGAGLSDACMTALPCARLAGVREALMQEIAGKWAGWCSGLWRFSNRGFGGSLHSFASGGALSVF